MMVPYRSVAYRAATKRGVNFFARCADIKSNERETQNGGLQSILLVLKRNFMAAFHSDNP